MSEQTTISSSSPTGNHKSRIERYDRRFGSDFTFSQLIWLVGDHINYNTITFSLENLRQLVDDIKLFDDSDKCKDFLEQTKDTTTFLVVSNQFEELFVPQIRHMKHIWSIHICYYQSANKKDQQQKRRTESKMGLIYINFEHLLTDLTQTIEQESNREGNAIFSNQLSTEKEEMATDDSLWSGHIEFLDFLCYLPNSQNYLQRLITFLEEFYKGIPSQLAKIKDFVTNYRSENAIQWYTKDTFVYRLLNRALRQHDIEVLFLFGFLIKDIQTQLKKEHEAFKLARDRDNNSIVKVYRGQMMSSKEIQQLDEERSAPWFVNNSYFSATFDRDVALIFLNTTTSQSDDELQSVLFEIEINTQIKSRPYGDVSQLSQFHQENEFLFTFGNPFVKTEVFYNETEQISIAQLQLNYDYYVKDDKEFISDNQRKMLKKCVRLLESVTEEMPVKSTNIIFNELIILYPSEKEWIIALKMCWLASKNIKEKDYTTALSNYYKALSIWHKFVDDEELNCFIDIARTHQSLALCYQYNIEDHTLAERQYLEAIQYFKVALKKTTIHYERMKIYEKLSYLETHRMKLVGYDPNDTQMVVRYEELSIANMLQYYDTDSVQLGQTLIQLADLKKFQFEYDESLANYERALNIFLQQSFQFDFYLNICNIINEMVKIYIEEKNSDYSSAIKYELIKHEFILKHFIYAERIGKKARCVSQYDVMQSHIELAYKYLAIRKRKTAQIHLTEVLAIYHECGDENVKDYKSIKNSQLQEQLSDISVELHQYEKAHQYMKMSMGCYQQQKYMLLTKLRWKLKTSITSIKHSREWEKLEIRGQVLQNKMINIQKLMANSNVE